MIPAERRAELAKTVMSGYDRKLGGWGFNQKYLYWDAVEYCLDLAAPATRTRKRWRATRCDCSGS